MKIWNLTGSSEKIIIKMFVKIFKTRSVYGVHLCLSQQNLSEGHVIVIWKVSGPLKTSFLNIQMGIAVSRD